LDVASTASVIFQEAIEEGLPLGLTLSGGFGRLRAPFSPAWMESVQRGWRCVGGNGAVARFDARAVGTHWMGVHEVAGHRESYLEALDVYGDLIFRINSPCAEAHRYWRALASHMTPGDGES